MMGTDGWWLVEDMGLDKVLHREAVPMRNWVPSTMKTPQGAVRQPGAQNIRGWTDKPEFVLNFLHGGEPEVEWVVGQK